MVCTVACDLVLLVLVLVVLVPRCCFSRLPAWILEYSLHDFGIGVAVVCDCFARILKVLFVVVVVADFPMRGNAGLKKRAGGAGGGFH